MHLYFSLEVFFSNWKQPLGSMFTNAAIKADDVKIIILDTIYHLLSINLHVVAVVSDQGSNFQKPLICQVCQQRKLILLLITKKFCFYDPPHVIKSVRNVQHKNIVCFFNKSAKWEHILNCLQSDSKLGIRLAPKLTYRHLILPLFSKISVPLALEVISHTVATGLHTYCPLEGLPDEAEDTAE